jgi:hypothetical protein
MLINGMEHASHYLLLVDSTALSTAYIMQRRMIGLLVNNE